MSRQYVISKPSANWTNTFCQWFMTHLNCLGVCLCVCPIVCMWRVRLRVCEWDISFTYISAQLQEAPGGKQVDGSPPVSSMSGFGHKWPNNFPTIGPFVHQPLSHIWPQVNQYFCDHWSVRAPNALSVKIRRKSSKIVVTIGPFVRAPTALPVRIWGQVNQFVCDYWSVRFVRSCTQPLSLSIFGQKWTKFCLTLGPLPFIFLQETLHGVRELPTVICHCKDVAINS